MRTPENQTDAKVLFIRELDNLATGSITPEALSLVYAASNDPAHLARLQRIVDWWTRRKEYGFAIAHYSSVRAMVGRVGDTIVTEKIEDWPSEQFMARIWLAIEFDRKLP